MRALRFKPTKWAVICVVVISGCAIASPSPAPVKNAIPTNKGNASEGTDAGSTFDNLEIVDASLKEKVAVLRVGSQVAENHLLTVFAGLKNKTARRLNLEVETIYRDKEDNALNAGSWIPVTLKPHEQKDYRSSAISEAAVDFLIRVRRAPNASTSTHG